MVFSQKQCDTGADSVVINNKVLIRITIQMFGVSKIDWLIDLLIDRFFIKRISKDAINWSKWQ